MQKVFLRTEFNYDRQAVSDETGLECRDPSRAQQNMKDECDINTIVKRFNLTGEIPSGFEMPQYKDFEGVGDYHTALNAVIKADEAFMELPATIRARFDHDPAKLIDFLADEKNRTEAITLGLVENVSLDFSPKAKNEEPTSDSEAAEGGQPT